MYFLEDFPIGERIETGRHTFDAEEIKVFARRYDPQGFHTDEAAAARTHFGALCASGWHTVAYSMRFLVEHRNRLIAAARQRGAPVARWGPSPGFRELKWPKPVFACDTVAYATQALETRRSNSRPGWGIVSSLNTGTNQHGDLVLSYIGAVFAECREM